MKIVVIDNFDSFVYNLVRYVREIDGTQVFVQRNDAVDYSLLDDCDAILLSPGPGIPDEAGELKNVIRRYSGKKKILGVCLGHQAIAEVFDTKLELSPEPVHGKSSFVHCLPDEPLFKGITGGFAAGRYHSWQVSKQMTGSLATTAMTEDGIVMPLRHVSHQTAGVQFHPESILTPMGRTIIINWINE